MSDSQKPLGLGFIGSGRIAQAHLAAASKLSDRVRVVAIAGRRRDRAEAAARQYGIPGETVLDGLQSPSLYTHQLREFADALRERRRPLASGREILNVMRMLDAARASAGSGQPVAV